MRAHNEQHNRFRSFFSAVIWEVRLKSWKQSMRSQGEWECLWRSIDKFQSDEQLDHACQKYSIERGWDESLKKLERQITVPINGLAFQRK